MLDIRVNPGEVFKGGAHPKVLLCLERAWVVKGAEAEINEAVI